MPRDIVVVGAGGFGRETLDVIEAMNASAAKQIWNILGVVDDAPADAQRKRLAARGISLLGKNDVLRELGRDCSYVIGIGSPTARARVAARLGELDLRAATVVHPSAVVGSQTLLGNGTVICAGAQISTNVQLGRNTHINPGAIVGHDSIIHDFVSINPGAVISGEVTIRTETLIGANATILQGITIGEEVTVGASACVTKSVDSRLTVKGIPAR